MRIILDSVTKESEDIRTFNFSTERPVDYIAGQFIELTLPHTNPDDRGIRRWFTLSSSPHQELISITTRFPAAAATAQQSSFKQALAGLAPGSELSISDPMGDFVLPRNTDIPLLFVAGGIGITPVISMAKWLQHNGEKRMIRLLHSVNNPNDYIYTDLFQAAGIELIVLRNRVSAASIVDDMQPHPDSLIYLSGPEAMVQTLEQNLQSKGISNQNIVTDAFLGY